MNGFLRAHRVLAVKKEFVADGENSFWTFCVEYLESAPGATGGAGLSGKPKVDYKEVLKPEEFEVFSRLRATASTPTGLQRLAQGCEGRATLGEPEEWPPTLKGLRPVAARRRTFRRWLQPRWGWADSGKLTQGSSSLATLGWRPESRWDSAESKRRRAWEGQACANRERAARAAVAIFWRSAGLQPALDEMKPAMNVMQPDRETSCGANVQSRSQTGAPMRCGRHHFLETATP